MTRCRFIFDSLEAAAQSLELVLLDARKSKKDYSFAGLSAGQILKSGLILEGDIVDVANKLKTVDGSVLFVE